MRPESKSRVITIDQIRDVLHVVSLKPTEARTKVAVVVDADRMGADRDARFVTGNQPSDIFTEMFDLVFVGKDLPKIWQILPHNLWIFYDGYSHGQTSHPIFDHRTAFLH